VSRPALGPSQPPIE